jgi:hypothetical protein
MRKITSYKLLKERYEEIDDEVREHINRGWQPYGDPYPYRTGLAQAVVRYEQEPPLPTDEEIKALVNDIFARIDAAEVERFVTLLKKFLGVGTTTP